MYIHIHHLICLTRMVPETSRSFQRCMNKKNNQVTRVTAKEHWVVWNVQIIALSFPSKPDHFKTPQATNRASTPDPTAPRKATPTGPSATKHLAPMLEQAIKSAQ